MNTITTFATGLPFSMTAGKDTNLDGDNTDRPNLVGNPHLSTSRPENQRLAEYFNPAAFQYAAAGMDGTNGATTMTLGRGTKSGICRSSRTSISTHSTKTTSFNSERSFSIFLIIRTLVTPLPMSSAPQRMDIYIAAAGVASFNWRCTIRSSGRASGLGSIIRVSEDGQQTLMRSFGVV